MKLRCLILGWMVRFVFSTSTLAMAQTIAPDVPPQIDKRIDTTSAYPVGQFIGIKADANADCPKIPGWQEAPLFGGAATGSDLYSASDRRFYPERVPKASHPERVPKELRRFCRYFGKASDAPYPTSPGLIRIDPDPVAVAPVGLSLADAIRPSLAQQFLEQVGRKGLRLPIDERRRKVRLAFLDTLPTGEDFEKDAQCTGHGDFVRRIGRAITWDEDRKMTRIRTGLALPIERVDPKTRKVVKPVGQCGGRVGRISDLAIAIYDEIDALEESGKPPPHLVINLSVAWDGKLFGGLNKKLCEMPAEAQAVYSALQVARDKGALVIAAVGNDKSGPNATTGPLLPAAWETLNPEECPCSGSQKPPLIYAVGGLGVDDEPIANARRPGSMPSLGAFADHATLNDSGPPTSAYTGTSVAAAVASSIAAAVWYIRPELDPAGVIDVLRQSGEKVELSDWTFGHVRRVLLCAALKMACPACVLSCCPQRDKEPIALSVLGDTLPVQILDTGTMDLIAPPDCAPNRIWSSPSISVLGGGTLCPARVLNDRSSEPWLHSQPGGDPCPNCVEGPPPRAASFTNHLLYVEIRKDWDDAIDGTLRSATLEVEQSGFTTAFFLQEGPFIANAQATVMLPDGFPPTGSPYSAYISWQVVDLDGREYSVRSPLLEAEVPVPAK